jgi:hypothetical protein
MPDFYVRAALFDGETPVKLLSGTPTQLNANLSTVASGELRVIPQDQRTTAGLSRTSLATDGRLNV